MEYKKWKVLAWNDSSLTGGLQFRYTSCRFFRVATWSRAEDIRMASSQPSSVVTTASSVRGVAPVRSIS
ncbi:hypothetical protein C0J52_19064 [Blattella germanica]|nr:hypothetical protein C0J52_19064 [Blattella germanica]